MAHHEFRHQISQLARDLQAQESHSETMQRVVDATVDLVGPCEAAGISLTSLGGRISTSASTGDVPRRGDLLQVELQQGPCLDAIWEERTVSVPQLETESRWTQWGPRAVAELGVRSMLCLRLFTHGDTVGALNLYATVPHAFAPAHVDEGAAIAAHAAVAAAGSRKIEHLEQALESRTTIAQAVGMIMARYELDSQAAFKLLTRLSNESNTKVSQIAADLIDRHDRGLGLTDATGTFFSRPRGRPGPPKRRGPAHT